MHLCYKKGYPVAIGLRVNGAASEPVEFIGRFEGHARNVEIRHGKNLISQLNRL
jgi:hypothetical protein